MKSVSCRTKVSRHPRERGSAVRDELIIACRRLLRSHAPSEITTTALIVEAGVARGTLYHHFKSASALLEAALLDAFSQHVDANITALRELVDHANNQKEFATGLRQVTKVSQGAARKETRFARVRIIAHSETSTSFLKLLIQEQERLTVAIENIVTTAQKKGWVKRSIKPRAAAVMIQAYTLGKIVDDVAERQMSESDWNTLIDDVVIAGMLTTPPR